MKDYYISHSVVAIDGEKRIVYQNVLEGLELFFLDFIQNEDLIFKDFTWSFDNLSLTSFDTSTEEKIILSLPNSNFSKSDIKNVFNKVLNSIKPVYLTSFFNVLKRINTDFRIKNFDDNKNQFIRENAISLEQSKIKKNFLDKKNSYLKLLKEKEYSFSSLNDKIETFSNGEEFEYYNNFSSENTLSSLTEEIEFFKKKIEDLEKDMNNSINNVKYSEGLLLTHIVKIKKNYEKFVSFNSIGIKHTDILIDTISHFIKKKEQIIHNDSIKIVSDILINEIGEKEKSQQGSYYNYLFKHENYYMTVNDFAIALVTGKHSFYAFSKETARRILSLKHKPVLDKIDKVINNNTSQKNIKQTF